MLMPWIWDIIPISLKPCSKQGILRIIYLFRRWNGIFKHRASIGVIDQKGIIKDNYMRNYTAKLDASQTMFNNKLKIDFGMFASK